MTEHTDPDRAVVTGGAGFVGSHLTRRLLERGIAVTVVDDCSSGDPDNVPDGAELIQSDVRDGAVLRRVLDDADVCFHQAALVSVDRSVAAPQESHATNVAGTLEVLEAARDVGVDRVVLASSAAIYGQPEYTPVDEAHPTEPTSPYGLEKLAADHYARLYADLYDLETVALRYFNVYGPGGADGDYAGVIDVFRTQAERGKPLSVHGDGQQTRDFVHVDDVVRANLAAATVDATFTGRAYNVGTGNAVTVRRLAELIGDLVDENPEIVHTDPREGDVRKSVADISAARECLGYEPTIDLETGLRRLVGRGRPPARDVGVR